MTLIYILLTHLGLLVALPYYLMSRTPSWSLLLLTLLLVVACGLSITIGYHRYFSHQTFQASRPVQWLLLLFGTLATQGSVLRWAHDHRLHHRHVDEEGDPYGTSLGFWHSHLLWMFKKGPTLSDRYLGNLKDDRLLVFQHRYYGILVSAVNLLLIVGVGAATGDWWGSLVFVFLLRTFVVHHTTWFINSLAHMWGSKPYSTEHSAVNNFILAFLTFGEGYHNYHHTFAGDYRNGIRWYQFDPAKYVIWLMSKLGLTWGLRRTDELMIRRKLLKADQSMLMGHLESISELDVTPFREAVDTLAGKISRTMANAKSAADQLRALDRSVSLRKRRELRMHFRRVKADLSRDLRAWKRLCNLVLELEPAYERA